MLKAAHSQNGEAIVILAPLWRANLAVLRVWDRQDLLLCPACKRAGLVRAGQTRRWHFAHKHLANCPFERQSALLLETRASLYECLLGHFDDQDVQVEVSVDGLPRPLDCQVGAGLAYWIFDQRMPPDEREQLGAILSKLDSTTWIFAASMLRSELDQPLLVHLTTTERKFKIQTESDLAHPLEAFIPGETLHYLDADRQILITYRNLSLLHPPQLYAGRRLESALTDLVVDPSTGDFLHPGEAERLNHYRQTQSSRQEKIRRTLPALFSGQPSWAVTKPVVANKAAQPQPFDHQGTCTECGQVTADWVYYNGRSGTCLCRACSRLLESGGK